MAANLCLTLDLDAVSGACRDRPGDDGRRLGQRADPARAVAPARAFPVRQPRPAQPAAGRHCRPGHGGRAGAAADRPRSGIGRAVSGSRGRARRLWLLRVWPLSRFWRSPSGSPIGATSWGGCAGNRLDRRRAAAITGAATLTYMRSNEPNFFRHPAHRQSASRQLSRGDSQLGRAAERLRVHFLHRRPARADPAAGSRRAARFDARGDGCLYRRRHRPGALHDLQPEHGLRSHRAGLAARLPDPARLAQPHDAIQGEGREASRDGRPRSLRLPGADGGGHSRSTRRPTYRSAKIRSSIWSWRATSPARSTAATNATSSRCPSRRSSGRRRG